MSLPAWMDAASGLNGERLLANSSEFTNWLHPSISGSSAYEAVVFPAPLHPDMTYSCGMAINFTVSVFLALVSDVLFQTPVFRRLSLTTYEDTENFRFRQSCAGDSWWRAGDQGCVGWRPCLHVPSTARACLTEGIPGLA